MTTFAPTIAPSYSSSVKTDNRILEASLGDGYTVRAGDGLNTRKRTWSLTWEVLDLTDADTIENFFIAQLGYLSFTWIPPRGTTGKWICKNWSREPLGPSNDRISTEFEEVFDL